MAMLTEYIKLSCSSKYLTGSHVLHIMAGLLSSIEYRMLKIAPCAMCSTLLLHFCLFLMRSACNGGLVVVEQAIMDGVLAAWAAKYGAARVRNVSTQMCHRRRNRTYIAFMYLVGACPGICVLSLPAYVSFLCLHM